MRDADSIYEFSAHLLDGRPLSLEYFRGHVLLVVNTASHCGFTPQYAALEALYKDYSSRGFEVLGFPCNQFGRQEPGSAQQIAEFCDRNYGVTFPVFARIEVNGPAAHPLYRWLKREKPGLFGIGRIPWNFTKFLIGRQGQAVSRHGPNVDPAKLRTEIEELLS